MVRVLIHCLYWLALALATVVVVLASAAGILAVLVLTLPGMAEGLGVVPASCLAGAGLLGTFFLAVAVHEAGHLVGGWCVGMTPRFVHVGPITFSRERGRWRIGWNTRLPLMGYVVCDTPKRKWQHVLFIAAGPLASLVLGLAAVALLAVPVLLVRCWGGLFAVSSVAFGLVCLLPVRERGFASDGLVLWCLLVRAIPVYNVRTTGSTSA